MAEQPTIGDLMMSGEITAENLTDAVDAYWREPGTTAHAMPGGYILNLYEAVSGSSEAKRTLADDTLPDIIKRSAVRTAILLARPVKG